MNRTLGPTIWQVDAFSGEPFAGNPAAVCIIDSYPSDRWMLQVAAEMNLSETAFIVRSDEPNRFQLRWFTPVVEVDLCGHATLAAAHLLIEQGLATGDGPIRFDSRSGELICSGDGDEITLDFPATSPEPVHEPRLAAQLVDALGITEPKQILRSKFDVLVVLNSEQQVRTLTPDFGAVSKIATRGVMVSALSDQREFDFVSRFFSPQCGINEDPVTGSAHCCLAPYWASELGRSELTGYQASDRGGTVRCEVVGDRVKLSGRAVTVLQGNLLVAAS